MIYCQYNGGFVGPNATCNANSPNPWLRGVNPPPNSCWVNTCGSAYYPECNPEYGEDCSNCDDCACAADEVCSNGTCVPACVPDCPVACGQPDGCGGTCANTDNGPPAAPALNPAEGGSVTISEGEQPTVAWSSPAKADFYNLKLYPTPGSSSCSSANVDCLDTTATTYSFDPVSATYFYQVQGVNTTCTAYDGSDDIGDWAEANFTINGLVAGQVKQDDNSLASYNWATKTCELAGAVGVQPGAGSQVVLTKGGDSYPADVDASGNYSVTVPWASAGYSANLNPGDPANWQCTCPTNCDYSGVSSPKDVLDFFVSNYVAAWFQVEDGNLHADNSNISVNIPLTCVEPVCLPYLITGTAGVASYTNSLSLGSVSEDNISQTTDDWQANTVYRGKQMGYKRLKRLLEDDPAGIGSWNGTQPGGSGVFLGETVSQTSGGSWTVASGQQLVLLTPNDLLIKNDIIVEEGGFLAIIALGDITIDDDVTNIQGVYIADGVISTCQSDVCGEVSGGQSYTDKQLVGEGIFIGWSGIELRRDFNSIDNNTYPAEKFIYRPDLQINAYRYLLKPHYSWTEVAP